MNLKLRLFISEMLGLIQGFLVAYCILVVFLYQTDPKAPLYSLGLLPIPFLSWLIRRRAKHIWSFLLLHGAILSLTLLASYSMESKIFYGLYVLATTFIAFYRRNKDDHNNIFYFIIVFLLFYMGTVSAKQEYLTRLIFTLAILFTFLHLLRLYLHNFARYFQAHSSITNVPYRQIRNTNNILVIFMALLCLFAFLLPFDLSVKDFLLRAAKGIIQVLFLIIKFFMNLFSDVDAPQFEANKALLQAEQEGSSLLQLILMILEWVILLAAMAVLLLLTIWSVYKLYQYFYQKRKHEMSDRVEFISPFTKKEASKRASSRNSKIHFGPSNNGVIRKHFRQAVVSSVKDKGNLPKSLTPADLADLIRSPGLGDLPQASAEERRQITDLYEKARYSGLECSREEVRRMKRLLK